MPAPIDFYFDFASPYGYVASRRIDALAEKHGRVAVWRPMMLGAAFKTVGTGPLVNYPIKGDYMLHDLKRRARAEGFTIVPPAGFPHATLAAARAFYWIADDDATTARAFARAFYDAYFGRGEDVSPAESTADIAASVGLDRDTVLAAVQNPAVKERLKRETDAAVERGVFGSPFIFVDGEPFWGSDRIDEVDNWLETGGW